MRQRARTLTNVSQMLISSHIIGLSGRLESSLVLLPGNTTCAKDLASVSLARLQI